MAVYKTDLIDVELNNGTIARSFGMKLLGEGDDKAVRFGVRLFRDGEPVDLTGGTVIGFFIRADGFTEIITNSYYLSRNVAYVDLTSSCYNIPGAFTLAIKVVAGDVTGTMRIVDGTVCTTSTDSYIDPGHIIPDLSEYMELAEEITAAAEDIRDYVVTASLISGDDYRIIVTAPGA